MKAVNLIPSEQRGGSVNLAGSSDGGAFIVLGLMAGLAALALLYGIAQRHIATRGGQVAALTSEAAAAQAQASQLAPYTSFVAMRNARQGSISQLVAARFDWAHAFHELGRVLPFDVSLTSVHGTTGTGSSTAPAAPTNGSGAASTAVSSATPPGTSPIFTIVGCATSQSEVAQTLARLRLIDGVTGVQLQSSTKSESGGSTSGSSSAGCPLESDPSFTAQITFAPLPTPAAAAPPRASAVPAATSATGSPTAAAVAKSASGSTTATHPATATAAAKGGS